MKNTKRIILFIIILIGGTLLFAKWALSRFDAIFDNLIEVKQVKVELPQNKINTEIVSEVLPDTNITIPNDDMTKKEDFSFIFPKGGMDLYQGCKYSVEWEMPNDINSINLTLIDNGTREFIGPIAGGIPKTISGQKVQGFDWQVGDVWPGKYYIYVSNINGSELVKRSGVFNLKKIPPGTDSVGIEKLCNEATLPLN